MLSAIPYQNSSSKIKIITDEFNQFNFYHKLKIVGREVTMKKLLFVLFIILFFGFQSHKKDANVNHNSTKDGVFVHISHASDDLHRLLMGLQMAVKMSEDKDVLVYFDIKGIEAVLKDSPDYKFSPFTSSKTQLQTLLAKRVIVMACPGCLKAAGKTEKDLMNGVKIADKEKFFTFTKERILSIDY